MNDSRIPPFEPQRIKLNHYWSKSLSELREKAKRKGNMVHRLGQVGFDHDYLLWESQLNERIDEALLERVRLIDATQARID